VIVPPRRTAVLSDKAATAPTQRDRHLQCIAATSRRAWQKASGYNKRAKVEASIGRWKQVIGDGLRSRIDERRMTEVNVAVDVLNRMLELGNSQGYSGAELRCTILLDIAEKLRDRIFEELRVLTRKKPSRWIAAIMGSDRPHVGRAVSIDDCHGA
jgi:hypothetical protein